MICWSAAQLFLRKFSKKTSNLHFNNPHPQRKQLNSALHQSRSIYLLTQQMSVWLKGHMLPSLPKNPQQSYNVSALLYCIFISLDIKCKTYCYNINAQSYIIITLQHIGWIWFFFYETQHDLFPELTLSLYLPWTDQGFCRFVQYQYFLDSFHSLNSVQHCRPSCCRKYLLVQPMWMNENSPWQMHYFLCLFMAV